MYFIKFYSTGLICIFNVLIRLNCPFIQFILLVFGNLIYFIKYFLNVFPLISSLVYCFTQVIEYIQYNSLYIQCFHSFKFSVYSINFIGIW